MEEAQPSWASVSSDARETKIYPHAVVEIKPHLHVLLVAVANHGTKVRELLGIDQRRAVLVVEAAVDALSASLPLRPCRVKW